MSLTAEREVFESNLHEWGEHTGRFVLIKGNDVVGFYDTYVDAIAQGYLQFDLEPFFVRQVSQYQSAQLITRLFA